MTSLLNTDGYKVGHIFQYPLNTEYVYSNWTPRKSRIPGITSIVHVGAQRFIKKWLIEDFNLNFFGLEKNLAVRQYKRIMDNYLGKDSVPVNHIEALHELGYLPLAIKSLPEGSLVSMRCPAMTIVNTDPRFYWLTNYIETMMSAEMWGITTSATIAREYRKILNYWCEKTGGDPNFVQFQGHDFSMRGMYGVEAAKLSGMGHLTSFVGTDTIPAIIELERYYGANSGFEDGQYSSETTDTNSSGSYYGYFEVKGGEIVRIGEERGRDGGVLWFKGNPALGTLEQAVESLKEWPELYKLAKTASMPSELVGCSVAATEHAVMCAGGKEDEIETFRRLIEDVYPTGIISVVSDTWDLWKVLTDYLPRLKKKVLAREGKLVIRPDSGDPVDIICGTVGTWNGKNPPVKTAEEKGVIELLWDCFGGVVNKKGFKVLDSHIGAIYGDSITLERAQMICERLASKGFCTTNIVFGIGSYTYTFNTRDTFGFAMKATHCIIAGVPYNIFKNPKTDDGTKISAKGLIQVIWDSVDKKYFYRDEVDPSEEDGSNCLELIFLNGKMVKETTLAEIRKRVTEGL